ncbi:uncharacterized protein LOC125369880 [Ricinus communis]|uniref:uncharacterized protein LOC125369880 n=1 Tax=Ricinus communis TaxID=3988 RepID=UPI00201A5508|nr:uncharacterized protein LOC125369880 [Ricinus communis]
MICKSSSTPRMLLEMQGPSCGDSHIWEASRSMLKNSPTLFEIPNYTDEEALFTFTDGLKIWTRLELERRGVQDLNTVVAVAESLIEIRRQERHKPDQERNGNGKSGGERHHKKEGFYKFDKPSEEGIHGNKDDKGGERQRLKCFFCDGPHKARECPTKSKLSVLVEEREEHQRVQEESKMGSLQLLSAKGRLFVEVKVGGCTVEALLDTGANNNFLEAKEAERLNIKYTKEQGWLKAINSTPSATRGFVRDVKVSLSEWSGLLDFSIITMDDYKMVLDIEFLDKVNAFPLPFTNTMCILEQGNTCMVPLK